MAINKNVILPTYQGNYSDMVGAIKAGVINSPCFMYLEDRNALAFIHWEVHPGMKKELVPHVLMWEQMVCLEEKVETLDSDVSHIKENGATVLITSDGGDF